MVQAPLLRRGLILEYITLGWNVVVVVIVYYGMREAIHALRESGGPRS